MQLDSEMQHALEVDGEKLRQLTGQDHGPFFASGLLMWPDVAELLSPYECSATGSRIICEPPPLDSDHDFLVITTPYKPLDRHLTTLGFAKEGASLYPGQNSAFTSWRRGNLNLIVTDDVKFASKHRVATTLCKRLNLLQKPDRIAVFQAVLYGKAAS